MFFRSNRRVARISNHSLSFTFFSEIHMFGPHSPFTFWWFIHAFGYGSFILSTPLSPNVQFLFRKLCGLPPRPPKKLKQNCKMLQQSTSGYLSAANKRIVSKRYLHTSSHLSSQPPRGGNNPSFHEEVNEWRKYKNIIQLVKMRKSWYLWQHTLSHIYMCVRVYYEGCCCCC